MIQDNMIQDQETAYEACLMTNSAGIWDESSDMTGHLVWVYNCNDSDTRPEPGQ